MAWTVKFESRALRELEKLDRKAQLRIVRFLRERIDGGADPRATGKALRGELGELWRYRVGEYRLICRIEDKILVVLVLRVAHRKTCIAEFRSDGSDRIVRAIVSRRGPPALL